MLTTAEKLRDNWNEDLKCITCCIDCYYYWMIEEDNDDFFTLVCTKPHLLVFHQESEQDGSRWWPAKVLSDNGDGTVIVECFGAHKRTDCKLEQCILYADSEEELREKMEQAMKSKRKHNKKTFQQGFAVMKN